MCNSPQLKDKKRGTSRTDLIVHAGSDDAAVYTVVVLPPDLRQQIVKEKCLEMFQMGAVHNRGDKGG